MKASKPTVPGEQASDRAGLRASQTGYGGTRTCARQGGACTEADIGTATAIGQGGCGKSPADPEVISDEQRQEALSAAQSADPKLATADFIDGALDGEALRQAASAFQRGLNEASARLDQAQTERLCGIRRLLYFKTITAIAACWRIIASALRKRRRLRGFKCAARGDDCGRPGVNTQDVSLFVPQSPEEIDSFIVLKSRGQEQMLSLTDGGAIITEARQTV